MFVDNRNLDVKYMANEEQIAIMNQKMQSDKESKAGIEYDNTNIGQHPHEKRVDTVNTEDIGHLCHQFRILCSNFVFIFVTLCLCSVFFVVTGIQFWTTAYFLLVLQEDPNMTMITFSLV